MQGKNSQTHFFEIVYYFLNCNDYRPRGRPQIEINIRDVEFLRNLRFSWERIGNIIGVSRSTLYRRLDQEGISRSITYTDISDYNLDRLLRTIKLQHPHDGERMMIGYLARSSVRVPRSRLRASIHRVDPINTAIRRSIAIRRRRYHTSVWSTVCLKIQFLASSLYKQFIYPEIE